MIEMRAEQFYY